MASTRSSPAAWKARPASRITPGRLASTRRGDDDRERSDAQTDRESFDQHAREPVALQRLSVSEHDKPIASCRGVSSRIGPSEFVDLRGPSGMERGRGSMGMIGEDGRHHLAPPRRRWTGDPASRSLSAAIRHPRGSGQPVEAQHQPPAASFSRRTATGRRPVTLQSRPRRTSERAPPRRGAA